MLQLAVVFMFLTFTLAAWPSQAAYLQIISTVAGGGTAYPGDGGLATVAQLNYPQGVAVDSVGNIYFSERNRIRKVAAATGIITTIWQQTSPQTNNVAVDSAGNIYIACLDDVDNRGRILKVTAATGSVTTVAGGGTAYPGDGGPATAAELYEPRGVAVDSTGNIYIADDNASRIRKVTAATGIITTVAGNGTNGYSGDGGPATAAQLYWPNSVAVDSAGNVYIADGINNRIRKVTASTGIITTVAGGGTTYPGNGIPATTAQLGDLWGVAVDSAGNIYIADNYIQQVDATTGIITTVAGNGTYGYSGDGGLATAAELNMPWGVAVDSVGNIIFADYYNYRIREVSIKQCNVPGVPTGISAIAGYLQATISFTAPADNGGTIITSYTVTSNPVGKTATGSASPITVTGLTGGAVYTFTVTATNAVGTGSASSPSNSVTPYTLPGAPTSVSATAGIAQTTVSFTAPASNGSSPITSYTVTSNPGNITATGASSPITVTGLTGGTAYTFTATATNAAGTGPASSPSNSVTPTYTVPGAPTAVSASPGNAQATVSFSAPASNGKPITSYTVTSSPGNITATGAASPITVTGLTNGTAYTFTVIATNAAGTGPTSMPSNSVTPSQDYASPVPALGTWGLLTTTCGLALFLGFRKKRI